MINESRLNAWKNDYSDIAMKKIPQKTFLRLFERPIFISYSWKKNIANRQFEKSQWPKGNRKISDFNFGISKFKYMALELFEFQGKFLIDTFLIKLTLFEKTVSIGKIKKLTPFSKLVQKTFLRPFERPIFISYSWKKNIANRQFEKVNDRKEIEKSVTSILEFQSLNIWP